MRRFSRPRPSPAMVVALVALFVALGGVGYAATINGGLLKNRSVAGKKLKLSTVTGREVRESRLGKVPRARSADVAGAAFSTFRDAGIPLPDSLTAAGNPIATLDIPTAGNYVVNAKLEAFNVSAANSTADQCVLRAGADFDTLPFDVSGAAADDQESLALQVVHRFNSPGAIQLSCTDGGAGVVSAFFTKITAQQVRSLRNTGF